MSEDDDSSRVEGKSKTKESEGALVLQQKVRKKERICGRNMLGRGFWIFIRPP